MLTIQTDGAASGPNLRIQASPSLSDLFAEALTDLGLSSDEQKIGPLGSDASLSCPSLLTCARSDFTPFLQHAGIASSNAGYTSSRSDPVYHYHSSYGASDLLELC